MFFLFNARKNIYSNFPAGKLVILWRRGQNVLTAANMKVTTDDRIRLINGFNLEITELEPQDAGTHTALTS